MPQVPPLSTTALDPAQIFLQGYARQQAKARVQSGNGADWYGPYEPIAPGAPPAVAGRRFDFLVGENLNYTPKAYEGISYTALRNMADAYDVLRLVLETRKDQLERQLWDVVPKTGKDKKPALDPDAEIVRTIKTFFERPDPSEPNSDWGTWLRALLEDMFVIDAAAIYLRKTRKGQLYGLEQIDGATIKRVINDWGRTPAAPAVAYQEILKGIPAVDYTADELIYAPRNPRANRIYGFSHVEQVITTVNIGLRRETFMLQYYTEGNIPEALCGCPDDWTPDQIRTFQNNFDGMLAGNMAFRRRIKFVPGGLAKTFVATKEAELTGKMDEWLARVVCYALSVSPTPFVTQVNRATAESAQEAALSEGLSPVLRWVKRLVDNVIRRVWPGVPVEFQWKDDAEVDPAAAMAVNTGYATNAVKTINEVRATLGMDPAPGGDRLMVKTGSGYAPIDEPIVPATAPGTAPPGAQKPSGEASPQSTADDEARATKALALILEADAGALRKLLGEGAPAATGATPFRKGGYWTKANGHVHPPHQSGAAGGKGARKSAA